MTPARLPGPSWRGSDSPRPPSVKAAGEAERGRRRPGPLIPAPLLPRRPSPSPALAAARRERRGPCPLPLRRSSGAGAGAPLRAGGQLASRTGPGGASPPSPHCRGHLGSFRPGFGCVRAAMGKGEGARECSGPRRSFRDGGRRCRSPGAAGAVQRPSRGPAGREVSAGRARPALLRAGTRLPGQASGRRGDGTGCGGMAPDGPGRGTALRGRRGRSGRAEEAGTAGRPRAEG